MVNNKQIHCLELLASARPSLRRELLKEPGVIKLVAECCLNFYRGTFKVQKKHLTKLKPHRNKIARLASKSVSLGAKRKIIQSGGFLQYLIPAAIALISAIAK